MTHHNAPRPKVGLHWSQAPSAESNERSLDKKVKTKVSSLLLLIAAISTFGAYPGNYETLAGSRTRHFSETGYDVVGRFLEYWETNGGLTEHGYPISNEF